MVRRYICEYINDDVGSDRCGFLEESCNRAIAALEESQKSRERRIRVLIGENSGAPTPATSELSIELRYIGEELKILGLQRADLRRQRYELGTEISVKNSLFEEALEIMEADHVKELVLKDAEHAEALAAEKDTHVIALAMKDGDHAEALKTEREELEALRAACRLLESEVAAHGERHGMSLREDELVAEFQSHQAEYSADLQARLEEQVFQPVAVRWFELREVFGDIIINTGRLLSRPKAWFKKWTLLGSGWEREALLHQMIMRLTASFKSILAKKKQLDAPCSEDGTEVSGAIQLEARAAPQ